MTAQTAEPSQFGRYDLQELEHADVVSTVYRARAPLAGAGSGLSQQVALRIVDDVVAGDPGAIDGFVRANQRVAALDHAHVLRVVDVGRHDGLGYVASTWRSGALLADMLDADAPLPAWVALRLAGQLAEALDTVHEQRIVHGTVGLRSIWIKQQRRDRSPSTALLTSFGTGYLLAPLLRRTAPPSDLTDLLFVAPEQWSGDAAGPATDQYALACVLFTALAGGPPIVADDLRSLAAEHLRGTPRRLTDLRDDLDPEWDDIIARALSSDPAERYENCRTMVRAAAACAPPRAAERPRKPAAASTPRASQPAVSEEFPHTVATDDEPAPRSPRRGLVAAAAVIGVALLLALVALLAGQGALADGELTAQTAYVTVTAGAWGDGARGG